MESVSEKQKKGQKSIKWVRKAKGWSEKRKFFRKAKMGENSATVRKKSRKQVSKAESRSEIREAFQKRKTG